MSADIAVIAGDGIGKEVTAEVAKVLSAIGQRFGRRLHLEHLPWGADHYLETGVTLPTGGYDTLRQFDAIFIGARIAVRWRTEPSPPQP